MEYRQNDLYRTADRDNQKMPFYMTYPMQNVFLEEAEYERDMDRMKRMYPQEVRAVQEYVEEECDKLEYEGSMMFDEYPDRLMLRQICGSIYQKVTGPAEQDFEAEQYESVEAEELRMVRPGRPPFGPPPGPGGPPPFGPPPGPGRPPFGPPPGPGRPPGPNNGLQNLIEVLLYNEMYRRRCRHKRCRRWW